MLQTNHSWHHASSYTTLFFAPSQNLSLAMRINHVWTSLCHPSPITVKGVVLTQAGIANTQCGIATTVIDVLNPLFVVSEAAR